MSSLPHQTKRTVRLGGFFLTQSNICKSAIAPVPLATFAGEPTQNIGKSFLKSFAGVCIEGVIIVLACAVYSAFAQTSLIPAVNDSATAATIVWNYLGGLLLNMLILVGTVKAADRVAREMMGL